MGTAFYSVAALMQDERVTIARGLARRDPDLLDALILRYQHRLFRYIVHLTGRYDWAEDLFQETWIRVIERGRQYDGRRPFIVWLLAIARHRTIDWMRRKNPESLDALMDPEDDTPMWLPDERTSPFDALAAREQRERLDAALACLPAIYREVLVLRFREELSIVEIAETTGAPVSTVKSRLYRGLQALTSRIESES